MMLKVKTLLTKLISGMPHRINKAFTVPALTAGASGYWTIPISGLQSGALIDSLYWRTSNIAAQNGLQVTPCYVDTNNLYATYYAPKAVSANSVSGTFYVVYHFGGVS